MPHPRSALFKRLLAVLLLAAFPASAVIRSPALDAPADTLELLPGEARDFRFRRLAGHDLHQAGLILGLASVPVILLAPWAADRLGADSPVGDSEDAFFLLTYAALPTAASMMAAGNLVYAGAARYHPERDLAITRSPLPLIAFGLAAGKIFYLAANRDLPGSGSVEKGVVYAFAFTELLTMPALRGQFRAASVFLDQVRLRVTGGPAAAGLTLEFAIR
jgi:hypothetical protein